MVRQFILLCSCLLFLVNKGSSQSADSTNLFTVSGYVDAYYAYYTDSVGLGNFQKFPAISPQSEEFGLNTALLTGQYDSRLVRGIVSIQFGDISKALWPASFSHILQAHAGFRICKNLWFDAGFFRTHFGTEGLFPSENLLSSFSINTFFEPSYEAGARLSFEPGDKFALSIYGLNGYNIYQETNSKKSFGMLMLIALDENGSIGYSNYIGDDSPDGTLDSKMRFHQNLYLNQHMGHLKLQFGVDYGIQLNSSILHPTDVATMFSGVGSLKFTIGRKFSIAGRGEIFSDPDGFLSGTLLDTENKVTGYKLWGVTGGLEFKPTENSYLRVEGRKLQMDEHQPIFYWDGEIRAYRYEIFANVGVTF